MLNEWKGFTSDEVLDWLLEADAPNAPVRYLALRDLFDRPVDDIELLAAYRFMMNNGPIPAILSNQQPDGHWDRGDSIYYDKYTGTCWQIIMLAQMGADPADERVRRGCEYILDHGIGSHGGFSMNGRQSGAAHCLQGNLGAALIELGMGSDPRVQAALDWMARSVTGEGFSESKQGETGTYYLRSGISGPGFVCSSNDHEPCAWGAVKVAMALFRVPEAERIPAIRKAVQASVDFLSSVDPATAGYPHPYAPKPSTSWFKFGFPVFYITDLLQLINALVNLGVKDSHLLDKAVEFILDKRDADLRWPMEYSYNGKTWVDIEEKGKPSKWVTFRALRMVKRLSI